MHFQTLIFLSLLFLSTLALQFTKKESALEKISTQTETQACLTPAEGCVWLFQNMRTKIEICQNTGDLRDLQFDKKPLALQIGPNTNVSLYNNYNYQGDLKIFDKEGVYYLLDFYCAVSSVKVISTKAWPRAPEGCVWLYQSLSTKIEICQNTADLRLSNFDKKPLAIMVGSNTKVTLFNSYSFSGDSKVYTTEGFFYLLDFYCAVSSVQVRSTKAFTAKGYIKNALNVQVIAAATLATGISVSFTDAGGQVFAATVDTASGIYSVSLPAGVYTRTATLPGFVTATNQVTISADSDVTNELNTVLLSPSFEGWRAVLTWSADAKDLDCWVKLPDASYVYYNKKTSTYVTLDVDNRGSYGPETMTFKFDANTQGAFTYFVTQAVVSVPFSSSQAKVVVYHGDRQVDEIVIPTTNPYSAKFWNVFQIKVNGSTQTYVKNNAFVMVKP